jgi:hypothetical protein
MVEFGKKVKSIKVVSGIEVENDSEKMVRITQRLSGEEACGLLA